MFKRKKKRKYNTYLTLYGIIKIKCPESSYVVVDGSEKGFIITTISAGSRLFTIKMRENGTK